MVMMVRRKKKDIESVRVGIYMIYLLVFVVLWLFSLLYFIHAFQHKPAQVEDYKRDEYLVGIFTAVFFSLLGVIALVIVVADLRFELTGKWFMDIPLDIFTFRNASWWEVPVGFFIAIIMLMYSATTHSLLLPLPFATTAGSTPFSATGAVAPTAMQVLNSATSQAVLTAAVAPIENAALMSFPVATLTSLIMWLIFGLTKKKLNDKLATKAYFVVIIPVSLLVGGFTIFAHSLIYPPEVMQTTSISTFIFFAMGGIISGFRRSTLIWDTTHFGYNFGAIFFRIVSFVTSALA